MFNSVFVSVGEGAGSEPLGAVTATSTLMELAIAGGSLFYICHFTIRDGCVRSQMCCVSRREQGQRLVGIELHQAPISL